MQSSNMKNGQHAMKLKEYYSFVLDNWAISFLLQGRKYFFSSQPLNSGTPPASYPLGTGSSNTAEK